MLPSNRPRYDLKDFQDANDDLTIVLNALENLEYGRRSLAFQAAIRLSHTLDKIRREAHLQGKYA